MDHNFDTLIILAEVTIAFVAFSAIIASIRLTFGEQLSQFQALLVQFFTEAGMLAVTICLIPMILWEFREDAAWVAAVTTWWTLIALTAYLILYLGRRMRIVAYTPLTSVFVMIGYAIWTAVLILTLLEIFWLPSLAIITAFLYWALCSNAIIFVYFLSTFIGVEKTRD